MFLKATRLATATVSPGAAPTDAQHDQAVREVKAVVKAMVDASQALDADGALKAAPDGSEAVMIGADGARAEAMASRGGAARSDGSDPKVGVI